MLRKCHYNISLGVSDGCDERAKEVLFAGRSVRLYRLLSNVSFVL
jgi:hypothetical protein